jgi:hypothetical protein
MTDENSPQGAGDKDQDLDMERTVAEAFAHGDVRADGSEPVPGGPPPTGDPRVDDAVSGLRRLPGRPAEEHVAVLEEVHGRLRDILDDLGPGHVPAGGSAREVRGDEVPPDQSAVVPPGHAPAGGSGGVVPPGQQ